jgi:hypothetical protein
MTCATDEDIDVTKPDDGKNVFHWENISVDSTKINWDEIKKEESLKIMSNKSGVGEQEIKNGLASVTLPSLKENVFDLMDSKSNKSTSLYSSGKYISEFFLNRGQMDEYPDFGQIVDSDFVNALYQGEYKHK